LLGSSTGAAVAALFSVPDVRHRLPRYAYLGRRLTIINVCYRTDRNGCGDQTSIGCGLDQVVVYVPSDWAKAND